MNIYRVILKDMFYRDYVDYPWLYVDTREPVVEIVAARSRAQARYLVCKKHCSGDSPPDWPRISVVCTAKDVDSKPGIIDDPPSEWWASPRELTELDMEVTT